MPQAIFATVFTPLVRRFFGRLLLGLLLIFAKVVSADETNSEWLARSWQSEEGLPDNSVEGVAQTADGYLWIGTPIRACPV